MPSVLFASLLSLPLFHSLFRFYSTLSSYGINSKRGEIVVGIAEKLNNTYPGLYKPEMYEE